jgi:hypothetical protein|tara:strand:- start:92673 stop:92861 length:189 start_codon:yes stop_codon:yes gene_type:complete
VVFCHAILEKGGGTADRWFKGQKFPLPGMENEDDDVVPCLGRFKQQFDKSIAADLESEILDL